MRKNTTGGVALRFSWGIHSTKLGCVVRLQNQGRVSSRVVTAMKKSPIMHVVQLLLFIREVKTLG